MSKVVRSVKNVTKGYSAVQVKVRNGSPESRVHDQFTPTADNEPQQRAMTHGARLAPI